jgi:transposase-like protein
MATRTTGNLINLAKHFSDEASAHALLAGLRWPAGACCPKCGGADPYKLTPKASGKNPARQGLYKCSQCKKQFSTTTGTIFEASHVALSKWLLAIHLMASSKKGMSAHQLHRMLGVTYRAAWFMMHRLRFAMATPDGILAKLDGIVEVDETYIGARNKRGTPRGRAGVTSHKAPVVALVERGGRVRAFPMPRVTGVNMRAALKEHLDPNATVMTDELAVYNVVNNREHHTIKHKLGQYVNGQVHTNTVEGFFSLLKRGIVGSFHHVSKGHLHRYCDEFAFRYNTRTALGFTDGDRAGLVVAGAEGKRLTFKMPTSASA